VRFAHVHQRGLCLHVERVSLRDDRDHVAGEPVPEIRHVNDPFRVCAFAGYPTDPDVRHAAVLLLDHVQDRRHGPLDHLLVAGPLDDCFDGVYGGEWGLDPELNLGLVKEAPDSWYTEGAIVYRHGGVHERDRDRLGHDVEVALVLWVARSRGLYVSGVLFGSWLFHKLN
jgi:hypothetical protein